jgi:chloramphenicol 3-O-phosphotransferase
MQVKARVVLLNGVGSARKSSIAKALQTITAEPFLRVRYCWASVKPWGVRVPDAEDVSPSVAKPSSDTSLDWMRRYHLDAAV